MLLGEINANGFVFLSRSRSVSGVWGYSKLHCWECLLANSRHTGNRLQSWNVEMSWIDAEQEICSRFRWVTAWSHLTVLTVLTPKCYNGRHSSWCRFNPDTEEKWHAQCSCCLDLGFPVSLLFGHIESHHLTSWDTCGCIMSHCVTSVRIYAANSAGRYRETVENWSKAYLDTVEQARPKSRNLALVNGTHDDLLTAFQCARNHQAYQIKSAS